MLRNILKYIDYKTRNQILVYQIPSIFQGFLEAIGVLALGMKINIEKYYNMGDVIILPSSFGEGCPNVLLEGMLCKLFPVSTNVGDAKLIIEDTGLIIKTPAVNDIQKALTTVASMNKKEIKKISENALYNFYLLGQLHNYFFYPSIYC